jgi:hypothetical protein
MNALIRLGVAITALILLSNCSLVERWGTPIPDFTVIDQQITFVNGHQFITQRFAVRGTLETMIETKEVRSPWAINHKVKHPGAETLYFLY